MTFPSFVAIGEKGYMLCRDYVKIQQEANTTFPPLVALLLIAA